VKADVDVAGDELSADAHQPDQGHEAPAYKHYRRQLSVDLHNHQQMQAQRQLRGREAETGTRDRDRGKG